MLRFKCLICCRQSKEHHTFYQYFNCVYYHDKLAAFEFLSHDFNFTFVYV